MYEDQSLNLYFLTIHSASCPDRCSNHGECIAPNICLCEPAYEGTQCDIFSCNFDEDAVYDNFNVSLLDGNIAINCKAGYATTNGETSSVAKCQGGKWILNNTTTELEISDGICLRKFLNLVV